MNVKLTIIVTLTQVVKILLDTTNVLVQLVFMETGYHVMKEIALMIVVPNMNPVFHQELTVTAK